MGRLVFFDPDRLLAALLKRRPPDTSGDLELFS
jgi:hypothetical protein